MEEIWKDIKNFEGLYQVSNLGNIKAFPKNRKKVRNDNKGEINKNKL